MPVQPDLSVFSRIKTKEDFDREAAAFEIERQKAQLAAQGQDPAAVREWQAYNAMSPQDQQRYLQMKRADQIMNLGGTMAVRNPMGGIQEEYIVTPKMSEMPQFEADVESAKKRAVLTTENLENAKANLPKLEEQSRQILDVIGQIETSPGLEAVVGAPNPLKGGFKAFNVWGSPAADFQAKLDQLGGKQFLQAFESLKGGGSITQVEGQSATNAIARMQTSQSEQEFRKALDEFKGIINRAVDRARRSAQVPQINPIDEMALENPALLTVDGINQMPNPPQTLYERSEQQFNNAKKRLKYNPATGEFE